MTKIVMSQTTTLIMWHGYTYTYIGHSALAHHAILIFFHTSTVLTTITFDDVTCWKLCSAALEFIYFVVTVPEPNRAENFFIIIIRIGCWHDYVCLSIHLSVTLCIVDKRYILQQKCVIRWIGSAPRNMILQLSTSHTHSKHQNSPPLEPQTLVS